MEYKGYKIITNGEQSAVFFKNEGNPTLCESMEDCKSSIDAIITTFEKNFLERDCESCSGFDLMPLGTRKTLSSRCSRCRSGKSLYYNKE